MEQGDGKRIRIEEVIHQRFEKGFNDEREDLQNQIAAYKSELEAMKQPGTPCRQGRR